MPSKGVRAADRPLDLRAVSRTLLFQMPPTTPPPTDDNPNWRTEQRERRRRDFAEYFRRVCEQRTPLSTLPRKYQITQAHPRPPTLAFGLLRTRAQLFAYAQRLRLRHDARPNAPLDIEICLVPTLDRLSELIGEPYLSIIPAFSPTSADEYVVALYTNYTMRALKCSEEDEAEMVQMLQTELATGERPMWYWDGSNPY
ncbi:hypothetical protein BV25DRAFT_1919993 [Artomyces pyxidatus]|uniref:Uncharacterized protein n=1 Tax=Artomyces pyxidatus TaxID=48021 RepID=A0ACB8SMI3_9AGAM|nr:hypothetical protein BV25DRAFT_1919993 [Artomyces pyxidatus]